MTLGSGVVVGTMPVTPVGGTPELPKITIGNNVSIGDGTHIASSATAPVTIGNDVKIGKNVYIAPGVTLSEGVTIPDGAVILGNVDSSYSFGTSASTPSSGTGATTSSDVPLTVTVGQAVGQTMTIPKIDLRDGGMGEIIKQDADGKYSLNLTDAGAIGKITDAIQDVANERASLGASQSRLELAATTLQVEYENLSSAISRIRDVDVAEESTQYAKYNILVQSGTAMLAQANQMPNSVLKLLQG